ncbi:MULTISPECIES: SulP family inorganic anion transporter [unclassified Streptomyces]|uniref:SulP family inorganic anion transporter n=1 Tax=unclassified Streptomyces TaxID=2593676 RepID=UPI002E11BA44|nr:MULTISPECIES: SulP family inorganic anion transporter [unclassified Streptomyces]WSR22494.1 SulP family inorganic anion transporter [Streptomyces sp. NBC_01205]
MSARGRSALLSPGLRIPLAGGDPGRHAVLAAARALAVGLVTFGAWAVRLGFLADLLPRSVRVGYFAGLATIGRVAPPVTPTCCRRPTKAAP